MGEIMKYLEKLNLLAESLSKLDDKLNSVNVDLLVDKSDKEELVRIKDLLALYSSTILELAIDQNKEFISDNKEFTRDIIKEVENFITVVNDSLTI
jgi:hypothetical protein